MIIRLRQIFLCSVFLFPLAFTQTPSKSPSKTFHRKADPGTILFLFQNKLYPSLNTKLLEYQTAFEQDNEEEANVYDAFDTFSSAVPLYEPILNNWVHLYSNVYPPYAARAKYYVACAWAARGTKWAKETTEEQFQEMRRYYSLALEDIKSALTLNPKLDICYSMMITMGMCVSDERLMKNALAEALKYNPYGFHVRDVYLYSLTPRWGGSYQAMEDFCDEAEKYSVYHPQLNSLRSRLFSDKARVFSYEHNYEEAVHYFTKALEYREIAEYYDERGDCYYHLEDYRRALSDYEDALTSKPNTPEYMQDKANALYHLNRMSDAQELTEKAMRLDPNNKWIQKNKDFYESDGVKAYNHSKRGIELTQSNRYQEAISEFTEAIRLNGDAPYNYFARGSCYLQLQRYEEALRDFNDELIRKRDDVKAYDAIGWIQYHLGKYDEAISTVNTMIKLDPNNAEAYYNRALNYIAKGYKSDALSDANRACSMGYQRACLLIGQLQE
jgi:tetratricopeptide (TPR) repeat protein